MNVQHDMIGVFDSGLGGLSIAREIRRALPWAELVYAADSRYCPYGDRVPAEILDRSLVMIGALVERGAAVVVIACNTATAVALETARATFSVPIIGLEPAVKPATALSKSRSIGVIATPRTVASERLARLIERFAGQTTVHVAAAPEWVPLVERGEVDGEAALRAVDRVVTPLVERGVDTLVLGCTHFPFLRPAIAEVAGPQVQVIDSGEAVARRTATLVGDRDRSDRNATGRFTLVTTGDPAAVSCQATRLLGAELVASPLAGELLFALHGETAMA